MRVCNLCHIQVNTNREFCPLCGQPMGLGQGEGYSTYPKLELPRRRISRLKLLLLFTQVFLGATVVVDGFIRSYSFWYLVLLAGAAYTAASALWAARRKNNPGGVILKEVLLIVFPVVHQLFDPPPCHGERGGHHRHHPLPAGLVSGLLPVSDRPFGDGWALYGPVGDGPCHRPVDGPLCFASFSGDLSRADALCRGRHPGGAKEEVSRLE